MRRFDRDTILALDDSEFSSEEKKLLLDKFFPAVQRPMEALGRQWLEAKRWAYYLGGNSKSSVGSTAFWVDHNNLVRRANACSPHRPRNTVTAFSGWVFSLYRPDPNTQAINHGKRIERILQRRRFPAPTKSGWELVFQDPLLDSRNAKKISALRVNGSPIWGIPDLVLREKSTGHIIIVERKASNADIPTDGWPNVRAQLWAYSQFDEWCTSPRITLACEVWGFNDQKIRLRDTRIWCATDALLNSQNTELFSIYNRVT